jgi:hypothetical protein
VIAAVCFLPDDPLQSFYARVEVYPFTAGLMNVSPLRWFTNPEASKCSLDLEAVSNAIFSAVGSALTITASVEHSYQFPRVLACQECNFVWRRRSRREQYPDKHGYAPNGCIQELSRWHCYICTWIYLALCTNQQGLNVEYINIFEHDSWQVRKCRIRSALQVDTTVMESMCAST